jgi:hypothetical protein
MANQKNQQKTTKKATTSNPRPTAPNSKASDAPNLCPNPKPSWQLKNSGVESEAGTNPDIDVELVQKATKTILGPHNLMSTTEWTANLNGAGSSDSSRSVSEPRDVDIDEDDVSSESSEDGKVSHKLSWY